MNIDEYIKSTGINFNTQQLEAIKRVNGATLILAVPGSGKTTTVIARIGYMVKALGIDPKSILTITYTRAATASMRERYERLFGSSDELEFRTIHGICAKILSYFERVTGRKVFRLIEKEGEHYKILREIYTQMVGVAPNEAELDELSVKVAYHRNMLSGQAEVAAECLAYIDFAKFYDAYKVYKIEHKLMDHDDQLEYAYSILRTNSSICEFFKRRYKYINVDEAQDTSKLQHKIIRLLVDKNIFMVGDEDQSIYGFRAAYPEALLNFESEYEGGKVLLMETNYRSTSSITSFSNSFIKHNTARYEKNMRTPSSSNSEGTKPALIKLHDFTSVIPYLVSLAKKTKTETAIIYRYSDSSIALMDEFIKHGIEFNVQGGDTSFFTSRWVVNLCNMLQFVMNPHSAELFLSVYYLFKVGMSRENAEDAIARHRNSKLNIIETAAAHELTQYRFLSRLKLLPKQIDACSNMKTFDALRFCAEELMHRHTFFSPDASDCHKLNVLLAIAQHYPDKAEFLEHMAELEHRIRAHQNLSGRLITLSTIHSAKGLEYDRVVLIDVKAGVLPMKSSASVTTDEEKREYEEDRRLLYVAFTRAKRDLTVFTAERENGYISIRSPFIDESFYPEKLQKKEKLEEAKKVRAKLSAPKETKEVRKPKLSLIKQAEIKSGIEIGAVIMHKVFGRCVVISKNNDVMRIRVFSDGSIKPIHIDTAVQGGIIELTGERIY